jgi:hypothetical protein
MSGTYQYPHMQYGHPDQNAFGPGGGGLPGLNSQGNPMQVMPGMAGVGGFSGIMSTGSPPLSQAGTVVAPMSTPSPASYSNASPSTMGHSSSGKTNSNNGKDSPQSFSHGNPGLQSAPGPPGRYGWPFWISAQGISRQVINEQVCKNLGNEALVRKRTGTGENEVCILFLLSP